jgi:hypothetical protein
MPRKLGWAGRVTVRTKKRSLYWFSVGKPEERRPLSRLGVDGRIILIKLVIRK